jgi:uncharacterized protein YciI
MVEKRSYIYVVRPPRPTFVEDSTPAEVATVGRHFDYVRDLTEAGIAVLVGRTDQGEFGIVVFEAESDEKAREIAESDPAVAEKLFTVDLYPFRIALHRMPVVTAR